MVRTRNAILPDVEQIHAIIRAYSGNGTLLPRTLAELRENVRDFVVAEDDDKGVIVGCGALGTVQAETLARAGVGNIRLIDRDFVEWSNLQRQFLFDEADASEASPKAIAAARYC